MRALTTVLAVAGAACGGSGGTGPSHAAGHPGGDHHADHHAGHDHDFSDVETFAAMFDDPERDAWQKPSEVVERMELEPGMTVVDLGAGTGYFLRHLSEAVGADGRVLGLDTEPGMVEHMRDRIAREQLANAEARVCEPDDPGLGAASVDRVLIVNTWHHIGNRARYAAGLREALRPNGRVVVVDFTRESEHGPPPEMRLSPEAVMEELRDGGLEPEQLDETLPNQYVVQGRR